MYYSSYLSFTVIGKVIVVGEQGSFTVVVVVVIVKVVVVVVVVVVVIVVVVVVVVGLLEPAVLNRGSCYWC
ncbi:hypothetical protein ElyMa_003050200 [Elysia marginata]|uniref:Transmembrane protein n=1 Tax=Elysia marginata TaxID=1093978 RepID=A0AAV4IJ69_9GAST|nr:hypothetical protein ElyMa_003050200 [Elysia marginata]